jgi:hypothetical protein
MSKQLIHSGQVGYFSIRCYILGEAISIIPELWNDHIYQAVPAAHQWASNSFIILPTPVQLSPWCSSCQPYNLLLTHPWIFSIILLTRTKTAQSSKICTLHFRPVHTPGSPQTLSQHTEEKNGELTLSQCTEEKDGDSHTEQLSCPLSPTMNAITISGVLP